MNRSRCCYRVMSVEPRWSWWKWTKSATINTIDRYEQSMEKPFFPSLEKNLLLIFFFLQHNGGVKKKMVVVNDHKEICILFLPLFFCCFKRPWNVFEMEIYTNHSRLPDGWITIVVVVYFCCFFSWFWNFSLLSTTDSKYTRACEVKETEFSKTHTVYQKVVNSKCSFSKTLLGL